MTEQEPELKSIVELSKSGRAKCRTCREGIEKGDLRFGEATVNAYSDSGGAMFMWHHLECAAKKKPHALKQALATFEGEVPNRPHIEETMRQHESKEKPTLLPYAERAPSGRARCNECRTEIEKGSLRIAVSEGGHLSALGNAGMTGVTRYLHVPCARTRIGGTDFLQRLERHSYGLAVADFREIENVLMSLPPQAGS